MVPTSVGVAILGGALLALAAAGYLLVTGRIAGIGGMFAGLVRPVSGEVAWRVPFLIGLIAAGGLVAIWRPALLDVTGLEVSDAMIVVSGLLMGFGGRMCNGCTSGHGVCGMSRLSKRSLVATCVFFATAVVTVFVARHVLGTAG